MEEIQDSIEMILSFRSIGKNPQHPPAKASYSDSLTRACPCSVGAAFDISGKTWLGSKHEIHVTHVYGWGIQDQFTPKPDQTCGGNSERGDKQDLEVGNLENRAGGISFFRNTNEIKTTSAFYSSVLWALQVCGGGFTGSLSSVWGCRDVFTLLTKESDLDLIPSTHLRCLQSPRTPLAGDLTSSGLHKYLDIHSTHEFMKTHIYTLIK